MCCEESQTLNLPAEVIEALAHYRRLLQERGSDWGDERVEMFRWVRFSMFGPIFDVFSKTGDWPAAVREIIGSQVPAGIVVVRIDERHELRADVGPARPAIPGRSVPIDVVVDSAADADLVVEIAGKDVRIPAGGAAVQSFRIDGADPMLPVVLEGRTLRVEGAVQTVAAARLRLSCGSWARWSVSDMTGGGWFPDGLLAKWDVHHRPFFHGRDITLDVPAGRVGVACTRGLGFERIERQVVAPAGQVTLVECEPARLFDPAADGWYGGDLHIHMNYSGDLVCSPRDAARMQLGEGLHLANFVAGNFQTSMVYDRDMLEQFVAEDLPWSTADAVARMGVEYRNDLLGHVHALGPSAPPSRYYSGFERSEYDEDWPPNSAACAELRGLEATIGYAHPAFSEFGEDWSTDRFFGSPRSVEARELVADAALGLVDSIDVISPFEDEGAVFLYHRLLSCGLRLAATAGTDVFLSCSHGPGVASNPPGWGRVYAYLGEVPLSVDAFKDAIRAGRTVVTNGPWLTLDVNEKRPGAVLTAVIGDRLDIVVGVCGNGAERLSLVGPDGVIAEGGESDGLRLELAVDGPSWIAAIARGPGHPDTLDNAVLAHTSPVYVDVGGSRVARSADARWCLDFLDTLEEFVHEHGLFHPSTRTNHLRDHAAVLDRARSFYRTVADSARR